MTAPVQENSDARDIAGLNWRVGQLARRPGQKPAGLGIFEIKVFEDDVIVEAGDGAFKFAIPSDLDESTLVDVEAWITGVSSSGDVVVSLYNNTQGLEMLSTPLTIDVGDLNDSTSGTPFVINVANADVAEMDELWVNVDNAGSGAFGLGVKVAFTPSENAAIALRGARGAPGGVTSFQGAWTTATGYTAGDVVTNDGVAYVAIDDHTSGATTEPGVGVDWEDHWLPLVTVPLEAGITANVHSSQGAVPDGQHAILEIPFDATIVAARITSDIATDAVIDIWKTDWGGYPPTSADSITAAAPPTLTGAVKNEDSTLTGWDTSLLEGDILVFDVSGVTLGRRVSLILKLAKGA